MTEIPSMSSVIMPTAYIQLSGSRKHKYGERDPQSPRRECALAAELQALKIEPHQGGWWGKVETVVGNVATVFFGVSVPLQARTNIQ